MSSTRKFDLQCFSSVSFDASKPIIFAVNHTNSHDIPTACEILKEHIYIFAGKENLRFIDRIIFRLNGVCFVDRKSKKSRAKAKERLIDLINKGQSIMIFPEGTWNLTENKLMLPLHWGIIEIAQRSGAPIVPLILDYNENCCCYYIGAELYINDSKSKKQSIIELRDKMSGMRYDIWASRPLTHRTDILKENFDKLIQHDLDEYPLLDVEFEKTIILNKWQTNQARIEDNTL